MKRMKFAWHCTDEEAAYLAKLAKLTGHESIRELFGTLVNAGLETLTKSLEKVRSEDAPGTKD